MKARISSQSCLRSFINLATNFGPRIIWILLECFALYFVIRSIAVSFSNQRRMRKVGSRAARIPSWIPFELDVLAIALIHLKNDNFFPWAQELMNQPGRTVEFNILGARIVMTDDVENIKTVLSTNFSTWVKGHHMRENWKLVLGDSIFATDGQEWLANKAQLRGHLTKARPNDLELTETYFQELKKHLIKKEPQHIYDLIDRYQLDVVTRIFLGKSSDSLPALRQTFRVAMETILGINTKRTLLGPLGKYVPVRLVAGKSLKTVNDYIQKFVDRVVSLSPADLRAINEKDRNLVECLVSEGRDTKMIKDQLLAVLLGAKDPSSMSITWAIYELSRNPDVLRKLEAEIEAHVGFDTPPTAAQLKRMTYVKCIVLETLRVHHSLGFNMRTATEDTSLPTGGGPNGNEPVAILKGTQCLYSVLSMHHRTDIWGPEAASWNPERWILQEGLQRGEWVNYTPPVWDFIPFNHGPRVCLGRVFGQQQVQYALVRIYQEFSRTEPLTLAPQRVKVELNTKMASPFICTFFQRMKGQQLDNKVEV